nr:M20 family metallopeptidase [Helcococcus sueciensis]
MTNFRERIEQTVDERLEGYKDLALQIHEKPEVSNYEFFASETLSNQLKKEGFEVKLDVAGHRTGFDARYKSKKDGPVIVFYAEYDALQGLGHGCGHNLFGVTSSLAAVGLKSVVDEVGGEIRVYGTPGEEGGENGSAKGSFVNKGFFDDVDFSLGAHPGYKHEATRTSLAVAPVSVEFFGKSSHAAAAPEKGINALDAVISVFNNINALREHLTDDVRIHGIITDGGLAPNVVPDYAKALFYLRANYKPTLEELYTKFENIVKAASLATGAEYKFGLFQNWVDNTVPTPLFDEVYEEVLNTYGEEFTPVDIYKSGGSSDVGNISQVVPVIQPHISISDTEIIGHTEGFKLAAKSEKGLDSIGLGAKVLAQTALELILNPERLEKIKEQHKKNIKEQL